MKFLLRNKKNYKLITIIFIIVFLLLGSFCLYKFLYLQKLNKYIALQVGQEIVPLPAKIGNIYAWNYRIVTIAGKFLHNREIIIKAKNTKDAYIITPFERVSGDLILVNRGSVAKKQLNDINRPSSITKITGYLLDKNITPKLSGNDLSKLAGNLISNIQDKELLNRISPMILHVLYSKESAKPRGNRLVFYKADKYLSLAFLFFGMAFIILISYFLNNSFIQGKNNA